MTRLRLPQPQSKKPVIEWAVTGFFGRFMRRRGWGAFTLPLPGCTMIFYWDELEPSAGIRVHEFTHVYQTEGVVWVVAIYRYLLWLAFKGYRNHPYEIQANEIEQLGYDNAFPDWAEPHREEPEPELPQLSGRSN